METHKIEELYRNIQKEQVSKHGTVYEWRVSPSIMSRFIAMLAVDDHVYDSSILELGIGSNNFAIGLSLIGAGYVLGIDYSQEQLNVCNQNIELYRRLYGDDGTNIELLLADIHNEYLLSDFAPMFDMIVLNPPTGLSSKNERKEIKFIRSALRLGCDIVYCILSADIRDDCQRLCLEFSLICDIIATLDLDREQSIDFVKFYIPDDDSSVESVSCGHNAEAFSSIGTDFDASEHSGDNCSDKEGGAAATADQDADERSHDA